MQVGLHDTAVVHQKAELGSNVTVGPYSVIGENVKIGDRTEIGSNVLIDGHTTIGRSNRIFHGASIGTIPQDLKYAGARTFLRVGDNNIIREFVTINTATNEGESTIVGSDNLLMAYVHVAHNCVLGNHVILANAVNLAGHVTVDDYAIIGGLVPVHQFVSIGAHAMVGGGSRIAKDIPPFILVAGNPPRIGGINEEGLGRRGFTAGQQQLLKEAFRILFRSNLNVTQAVDRIEKELSQTPEIRMLVDFIRNSKRGITK